jgi:hypothetical protein
MHNGVVTQEGSSMDRFKVALGKYGDPRYVKVIIWLLSLIATALGIAACPMGSGGNGCGGS